MDCVTREVYTNPMFEPVSFEIPPKSSDIQQDHLENASSSWPVEQQKRLTVRGPIIPLRLLTEERLVELLGPIWCSNERSNDFSEEVGLRRYCMFELFPDIFAVVRAQLDSPADVGDSEFGLIMTHNAERDENKAGMFNVNNIIILTRVDDQFERSGYIDMTGGGSCEIYYIDHQRLFTDTKSNRLPWYNSDLERPWLDEVMRATFYLE
ncbi:MAG: hypothetical protein L6R41_007670 [Letrouitia leprolyta]|nr:MAG: hypothetical protein L6R41_007670 [Letrouitia leprolyta]